MRVSIPPAASSSSDGPAYAPIEVWEEIPQGACLGPLQMHNCKVVSRSILKKITAVESVIFFFPHLALSIQACPGVTREYKYQYLPCIVCQVACGRSYRRTAWPPIRRSQAVCWIRTSRRAACRPQPLPSVGQCARTKMERVQNIWSITVA